jgi:hypothetical protein
MIRRIVIAGLKRSVIKGVFVIAVILLAANRLSLLARQGRSERLPAEPRLKQQ